MRVCTQLSLLTCLSLLLWAPLSFSETSVWKVSKGDNSIYLGGTVHLLKPTDFPLPAPFEAAYNASQRLYFEVDIGTMNQPEVQARVIAQAMAPQDRQLQHVLSPQTFQKLASAAQQRGMDINMLAPFKVGMAIVTLQTVEFLRMGMSTQGVDMHFYQKARQDNKPIGFFETIDEQMQYLLDMGSGWEDDFVNLSLRDLDKTASLMDRMVNAWRQGKPGELQELFVTDMKNDYPRAYDNLMVKRNNNWMPQILQLFEQPGVELVLVGAAHMVGRDGLLAKLKQQGYTVSQM